MGKTMQKVLLRHTDEPQEGETAVYSYNPVLF